MGLFRAKTNAATPIKKKQAFSVVEVLVTLSIAAVIVSMALPRTKGMQEQAKQAQVQSDIMMLKAAVRQYALGHNNTLPDNITTDLTSATPRIITETPADPFSPTGDTYRYTKNGIYFAITSVGPDGISNSDTMLPSGKIATGGDDIVNTNSNQPELNLQTDTSNCGSVGNICPSGGGNTCAGGVCVCTPQCNGKTCGDDGCSSNCGVCGNNKTCVSDNCVADPTFTVTYNGNVNTGGSTPSDGGAYYQNDTVTVLANTGNLVRTHFTFAGWNTLGNGTGTTYAPGATFSMGSSNVTLYAKWTADATYTVTYNGNSNTGGSVPTDASTYYNGDTVTTASNSGNLVRTGYTFAGWNTAANGSGTDRAAAGTWTIGAANVTLYAKWTINTYTVTYNGNSNTGGSVPVDGSSPYNYNTTVTALNNTGTLVRTGYTFGGWNTAANGSGSTYAAGSGTFAIAANTTLYAKWNAVNYTVTYNGNTNTGGSVPTDGSTYQIGATVTVLGNTGGLTKTGYSFNGWNTAANGSGTSQAAASTFSMGSANVTLYAQWTALPTYTVTYNGNSNTGGAVPTDASAYYGGDTVTVAGNTGTLVRTHYTFAGWNTAANGSGTSRAAASTFSMGGANVTLYAQWTANATYTVTYNGNTNTGGSAPSDATAYYNGDTVTVAAVGSLTKTGYTFTGWNTAANGSGTSRAAAATFAIGAANVTLYAQWVSSGHSVTYNSNGATSGTVPTDATSYANGATVTIASNTGALAKTDSTFTGWNTAANGSGTAYATGSTLTMGSANVTLYAQWSGDGTYTINAQSSSGYCDCGLNPSSCYTVYSQGYSSTGSCVVSGDAGDGSGGSAYALLRTALQACNANATLSGADPGTGASSGTYYYGGTRYSVTYNGNGNTGGSAPTDAAAYLNGATVTLQGGGSLTKTGNTIIGWNTLANGSGTAYNLNGTLSMGSANVTLYAVWTPAYTVTYNGNSNTGGSAPTDAQLYIPGSTITLPGNTGNLVRTGYNFAGWNTLANGSGTSYAVGASYTTGGANATLYAKWTGVTYTVTYNGSGSTGGSVPVDAGSYANGATYTLLGAGTMTKTGYAFSRWNALANLTGTSKNAGDTATMGSANVTWYAVWNPTYTVTYNGNGSEGGSVPVDNTAYAAGATATIPLNTGNLTRTGYTFSSWNTAANGTGSNFGNSGLTMNQNWTLYAKWTPTGYLVTYNSNGATSGTVPTDATSYSNGQTVTVKTNSGGLARTSNNFNGWNTAANGSGTARAVNSTFAIGAGNVTLYARWTGSGNYTIDAQTSYPCNCDYFGDCQTCCDQVYRTTGDCTIAANAGCGGNAYTLLQAAVQACNANAALTGSDPALAAGSGTYSY
ncbi:MAG: InlB B-repeat-containing protein [Candidatus Omnitrophota bacterium]